jgi:hypothetical protein
MKYIILAILFTFGLVTFAQSVERDKEDIVRKNSFGISKDLFNNWPLHNDSRISYPYFQYAASYNRYFWGDDIIHGSGCVGLGVAKTTYGLEEEFLTHTTLHIPANISILIGKKHHFLVSGLGLFYNGTRIAPSPVMDIDDTEPPPRYFVNTIFTHFLMGYKVILKERFVINLTIYSGRRDLFDYNSRNKIVVIAKPHFQIKVEYLFGR